MPVAFVRGTIPPASSSRAGIFSKAEQTVWEGASLAAPEQTASEALEYFPEESNL